MKQNNLHHSNHLWNTAFDLRPDLRILCLPKAQYLTNWSSACLHVWHIFGKLASSGNLENFYLKRSTVGDTDHAGHHFHCNSHLHNLGQDAWWGLSRQGDNNHRYCPGDELCPACGKEGKEEMGNWGKHWHRAMASQAWNLHYSAHRNHPDDWNHHWFFTVHSCFPFSTSLWSFSPFLSPHLRKFNSSMYCLQVRWLEINNFATSFFAQELVFSRSCPLAQ